MATTQIPLLPTAVTADDTDNLLIRQGSVDKKVTREVLLQQVSDKHDELLGGLLTTGSGGNYLLATTRSITALSIPMAFMIKLSHASSGACTLTIDSAPAVALVDGEGTAITGDTLKSGAAYMAVYDGTQFLAINALWDSSETRAGLAKIATLSETDAGTDDSKYVTPLKLKNWTKDATTTTKGMVERATQAEADAQSDTTRYVTPSHLATLGVTGSVIMMASSVVPTGHLECNGAAVSRTTYSSLYSAIGNTWGNGNGSTTFNLPDMRGEFIRGYDHGRGVDSGRTVGSSQGDLTESHNHYVSNGNVISGTSHSLSSTNTVAMYNTYGHNDPTYLLRGSPSTADRGKSSSTGGSETRPRSVCVMYCIRT